MGPYTTQIHTSAAWSHPELRAGSACADVHAQRDGGSIRRRRDVVTAFEKSHTQIIPLAEFPDSAGIHESHAV